MSNSGVNTGRRRFLTAATTAVGTAGVVGAAIPFVGSWNPSARAKAAGAPVKATISSIEPGAMITVEWRGKPVYIVRRTDEALANLEKMNDRVSDPKSEKSSQPTYVDSASRSIKPEFLVLLGLCTHLGCAPKFRSDVVPQTSAVMSGWVDSSAHATVLNLIWQGGCSREFLRR